jgi:hypothetical protein
MHIQISSNLCLESKHSGQNGVDILKSLKSYIVIETPCLRLEHIEIPEGIVGGEILKLDKQLRKNFSHGFHKLFHKRVHLEGTRK